MDLSGPAAAIRHARAVAWVSGALVVWTLAGALGPFLSGFASGEVALVGILPAALLSSLLLLRPHAARVLGGLALTLAVALAVGGHAVGPRGADLSSLLPPDIFATLGFPRPVGIALAAALLLVVPLWAAARVHATGLSIDASGGRSRSWRLDAVSIPLRARGARSTLPPAGAWVRGLVLRLAEGYALLGLSLARPAMRVHAEADLAALADTLRAQGAAVETAPGALVVADGGARASVRESRIAFPRVRADGCLVLVGDATLRARIERALREAAFARHAWSAQARRWERRIDALFAEAAAATSIEERGVLLEEADRVVALVARRELSAEERALLAWKAESLRARIAFSLTEQQPGAKRDGRVAAPGPALPPALAHLMGAGGLDAMQRVEFAPVWVLPVSTPWGQQEVAVDARAPRFDADASAALLDALDERAPLPFLDVGRRATFAAAPPPTAAMLRPLRETLPPGWRPDATAVEPPIETVFVPFAAAEDGRVNLATGTRAPLAVTP